MAYNKTAVIFIPVQDGDYSGFVFSEEWCQTAFLQFGYHFRGKYAGVQRDAIPWLWVSNRGEKHPCWHTILLAKSSVLYLLRPLTLERGCPTLGRHFSAAAEQADFVDCKRQKTRNLQWAKSDCSCVVGIGNLAAKRRDLLCQRGRKRYI